MAEDWLVPALAGAVSLAFAGAVARQWWQRRRPHQLAWALGIGAYAIASLIEARVAATGGWSVPLYAAYFPLACLNVGLLGLGTIYLLRPGRWGAVFAWSVAALGALAVAGPWLADLDAAALASEGLAVGTAPVPYPNPGRVAFLVLNVAGGLALIGGALWSYVKTRAPGVLLIGVGALLPALGGALASWTGYDDRIMMQFMGIVVMFAGYVRSREAPARATSAETTARA